ncbi:hypothetical protein DL98DRAFT_594102 [Cadophora sp. DSE1049]|nr:hypothetical protein DL98DRAFT_594102 [Cadophora sp. DSE1049]
MDSDFAKLAVRQQWDRQVEAAIRKMEELKTQEQAVRKNAVIIDQQTNITVTTPQPTFHPFVRFPFEIRAMIWANLIPGDRIVPIQYHRDSCSYTSRMLPPVILQINAESRTYGKKIYKEITLGSQTVTGAYMNMARDILYIRSDLSWLRKQHLDCEVSLCFREWDWRKHAEMIWDDLTKTPDMPDLTKRLVTCAGTYGVLIWHIIPRRSKLSPPIEKWAVVSEEGQGMFRGEDLRDNPELDGWQWQDRNMLKDLGRTVEKINCMDAGHGKPATLEFKIARVIIKDRKL